MIGGQKTPSGMSKHTSRVGTKVPPQTRARYGTPETWRQRSPQATSYTRLPCSIAYSATPRSAKLGYSAMTVIPAEKRPRFRTDLERDLSYVAPSGTGTHLTYGVLKLRKTFQGLRYTPWNTVRTVEYGPGR